MKKKKLTNFETVELFEIGNFFIDIFKILWKALMIPFEVIVFSVFQSDF